MVYGLVPEMTSDDLWARYFDFSARIEEKRGKMDGREDKAMVESASSRFLSFTEEGISGH